MDNQIEGRVMKTSNLWGKQGHQVGSPMNAWLPRRQHCALCASFNNHAGAESWASPSRAAGRIDRRTSQWATLNIGLGLSIGDVAGEITGSQFITTEEKLLLLLFLLLGRRFCERHHFILVTLQSEKVLPENSIKYKFVIITEQRRVFICRINLKNPITTGGVTTDRNID